MTIAEWHALPVDARNYHIAVYWADGAITAMRQWFSTDPQKRIDL